MIDLHLGQWSFDHFGQPPSNRFGPTPYLRPGHYLGYTAIYGWAQPHLGYIKLLFTQNGNWGTRKGLGDLLQIG